VCSIRSCQTYLWFTNVPINRRSIGSRGPGATGTHMNYARRRRGPRSQFRIPRAAPKAVPAAINRVAASNFSFTGFLLHPVTCKIITHYPGKSLIVRRLQSGRRKELQAGL